MAHESTNLDRLHLCFIAVDKIFLRLVWQTGGQVKTRPPVCQLSRLFSIKLVSSMPWKIRPQIIPRNYSFIATELTTKITIFLLQVRRAKLTTNGLVLCQFFGRCSDLRFQLAYHFHCYIQSFLQFGFLVKFAFFLELFPFFALFLYRGTKNPSFPLFCTLITEYPNHRLHTTDLAATQGASAGASRLWRDEAA